MLRNTHVTLVDWLRKTVRPKVSQMTRGYVEIDSADLAAKADGEHVGSALGLRMIREEDLANGKYSYKNPAGSILYKNWT